MVRVTTDELFQDCLGAFQILCESLRHCCCLASGSYRRSTMAPADAAGKDATFASASASTPAAASGLISDSGTVMAGQTRGTDGARKRRVHAPAQSWMLLAPAAHPLLYWALAASKTCNASSSAFIYRCKKRQQLSSKTKRRKSHLPLTHRRLFKPRSSVLPSRSELLPPRSDTCARCATAAGLPLLPCNAMDCFPSVQPPLMSRVRHRTWP